LPGEESFQSKSIESKKSTDHMPSSPEDGEITDEDISLEDNCVEVRITITILNLFIILTVAACAIVQLHFKINICYYTSNSI
jgi:hypothetical protein